MLASPVIKPNIDADAGFTVTKTDTDRDAGFSNSKATYRY